MNNIIIKSVNLKERNPALSFFLSLFITGLGQVYNGEVSKGFAFFLIRTAITMFIPIFVSAKPDTNHTSTFLSTIAFLFLIILISAFEALFFSMSKKEKKTSKFNSLLYYIIFSVINIITTVIAMSIMFSFFSIKGITTYESSLKKKLNEYILVNKYNGNAYTRGDMILFDDKSYYKIIGNNGDVFTIKNNVLYVNNEIISTLDNDQINTLKNSSISFKGHKNRIIKKFELTENEFLIQNINRTYGDVFHLVRKESLRGRIEGIIFSWRAHRFFSLNLQ